MRFSEIKPKDTIPTASTFIPGKATDFFYLEAKGSGMEPRINNGDMLLCQHKTDQFNELDLVILYNKKKGFECKVVYFVEDKAVSPWNSTVVFSTNVYRNTKGKQFKDQGYTPVGVVRKLIRSTK